MLPVLYNDIHIGANENSMTFGMC